MKHELNEIWKEQEGSKIVWKLQAPYGILTFSSKKKADAFRNTLPELVPMPVNRKAQAEYNKRFGVEE